MAWDLLEICFGFAWDLLWICLGFARAPGSQGASLPLTSAPRLAAGARGFAGRLPPLPSLTPGGASYPRTPARGLRSRLRGGTGVWGVRGVIFVSLGSSVFGSLGPCVFGSLGLWVFGALLVPGRPWSSLVVPGRPWSAGPRRIRRIESHYTSDLSH